MSAVADMEPDDPFLGVTLAGTYRIERRLAEGGMGRLYEATHLRLEMKVAVKALHQVSGARAEAIERARREARAMATLASGHVVRIFDVVPGPDGRPCLVTELLVGEDLGARLAREGKLDVAEAVRIACATGEGLAEAHRRGVLHRDIKPSNVFITEEGDVKLIDFGVAKMEDSGALTHAGAFIGTPAYMSPEQAASASGVDERSDIYGLGAVLYHMLSGSPPYGELDATQTLTRLLGGEPPRLTAMGGAVTEALAALVEKAMSREPDDRFASVDELTRELSRFERAGGDPTAEREARWLRPAAIVAVLATAVLTALWSAALCASIGNAAGAFEGWPDWVLVLYRTVPAVVLLFGLGTGLRSIVRRWRSAPRVRALLAGLRRTAWISAGALGVFATAQSAVLLYPVELGLSTSEAQIAALVVAVLLAATVAAIGARLTGKAT